MNKTGISHSIGFHTNNIVNIVIKKLPAKQGTNGDYVFKCKVTLAIYDGKIRKARQEVPVFDEQKSFPDLVDAIYWVYDEIKRLLILREFKRYSIYD